MTRYGMTQHVCFDIHPADPHGTWLAREATRSLVDSDQGVCPDGHACALTLDMTRTCEGGEYTGDPLVRWDITTGDIDTAERNGARSDVVALARYALAMR